MKGKSVVKALLGAYALTTVLLLLLAFLLFQFDLKENMVNAGISAVYILSCFLGGTLAGRGVRRQKYLWGALSGLAYFALLAGVSCVLDMGTTPDVKRMALTMTLCIGGGMLGGMLS